MILNLNSSCRNFLYFNDNKNTPDSLQQLEMCLLREYYEGYVYFQIEVTLSIKHSI